MSRQERGPSPGARAAPAAEVAEAVDGQQLLPAAAARRAAAKSMPHQGLLPLIARENVRWARN